MALNLDNKTLTQRLLTKEGQSLGVSARGSLSKCALKLAEFKKSIEPSNWPPGPSNQVQIVRFTCRGVGKKRIVNEFRI